MASQRLPLFQKFIDDARAAWEREADTESRMKAVTELLRGLVASDELRALSRDWPSTEGHKNLLLYEDPDYGFAVNAVVRTPGRFGSVHDHAHAWTAYGLLDGVEKLERFTRLDDGTKEGYADVRLDSVTEGGPGTVDLVPPFDIHAEQGGPARSVAVIVRSERVAGKVLQGRYNPEKKTTHKGEGPTQVPFEVTAGVNA
jgi:predicted metal-dependent enzyme (double-stranded beta helix superfamily)